MRIAAALLAALVLGVSPAEVAGALPAPKLDFGELRALSCGIYYFWVGNPVGRIVFLTEAGPRLGRDPWQQCHMRRASVGERGPLFNEPGSGLVHLPSDWLKYKRPTELTDRRGVEVGRAIIRTLSLPAAGKISLPAAFDQVALTELLASPIPPTAPPMDLLGEQTAREEYAKNPSTLLALAYAELALLLRQLRDFDDLLATLLEAVGTLGLEEVHFRADVNFRKGLPSRVNFGRPETCLLYLLAEEYRRRGRLPEAVKWYKFVISNDPAGPYSWESLTRLKMVPDAVKKEFAAAQATVLATYPCVWGCVQDSLARAKTTKHQFAEMMPALIEQVIVQVRKTEEAGR